MESRCLLRAVGPALLVASLTGCGTLEPGATATDSSVRATPRSVPAPPSAPAPALPLPASRAATDHSGASARPTSMRPLPRATPAGQPYLGAEGKVAGHTDRVLVYLPSAGDNLRAIAYRFLGSQDLAWRIEDFNAQGMQLKPGQPIKIPLQNINVGGVRTDSYQTIPILCYHRFSGGPSKMVVSAAQFEAQLAWLAQNNYQVLRLSELEDFLAARQPLPERSVVITIDDGYESTYHQAFPALKKYGFPATLFVYTDFIGARDGLSWDELAEMSKSGIIDIQAHSKTHRNLADKGSKETDAGYRASIESEVQHPMSLLNRRLAAAGVKVRHFAYPFGDANALVLEAMKRHGYDLGVTVNPGGNPFFADPLMLRRTMIFGDHDLDDFKARVQTRRPIGEP